MVKGWETGPVGVTSEWWWRVVRTSCLFPCLCLVRQSNLKNTAAHRILVDTGHVKHANIVDRLIVCNYRKKTTYCAPRELRWNWWLVTRIHPTTGKTCFGSVLDEERGFSEKKLRLLAMSTISLCACAYPNNFHAHKIKATILWKKLC